MTIRWLSRWQRSEPNQRATKIATQHYPTTRAFSCCILFWTSDIRLFARPVAISLDFYRMPQYDLHVLCPQCGGFHDALTRVTLGATFDVRRVSDVYQGNVPLQFYQAVAQIHCATTDKPVEQENPDMMVLVAAGKWSGESKPQIRKLAQKVTRLPKNSSQPTTY